VPEHQLSDGSAGDNRPKRCKISREQLSVLIKSFDEEPLPNFDQRQALAKMLGMTPRSVQIWFQNRRQRLKPALSKGASNEIHPTVTVRSRSMSDSAQIAQQVPPRPSSAPQPPLCQHLTGQRESADYGIPGLAAATAAKLCGGLSSEMRMLQHFHTSTGNMNGFNINYDVMEPFAATKALIAAGYQPQSSLMRLSRHVSSTQQPSGMLPTTHFQSDAPSFNSMGTTLPQMRRFSADHSQQVTSPVVVPPKPLQSHPPAAQSDGLLMLLACAASS